jgi:hypothetical protein
MTVKRFVAILAVLALLVVVTGGCKKAPSDTEREAAKTEMKTNMAKCGQFKVPQGKSGEGAGGAGAACGAGAPKAEKAASGE